MRVNKNELRVCVDVDLTLVRPCRMDEVPNRLIDYYGEPRYRKPMLNNIALLKSYKARGYEVTVHSANGWQWAQNVVEALGLQQYVDEVATKFLKAVDDLPPNAWLPQVFVPEDGI